MNRSMIGRTLVLGLLLLAAWGGSGCGGFNANVPISPLWFIRTLPSEPAKPLATPAPVVSPVTAPS